MNDDSRKTLPRLSRPIPAPAAIFAGIVFGLFAFAVFAMLVAYIVNGVMGGR
jgi:hypothetical protein